MKWFDFLRLFIFFSSLRSSFFLHLSATPNSPNHYESAEKKNEDRNRQCCIYYSYRTISSQAMTFVFISHFQSYSFVAVDCLISFATHFLWQFSCLLSSKLKLKNYLLIAGILFSFFGENDLTSTDGQRFPANNYDYPHRVFNEFRWIWGVNIWILPPVQRSSVVRRIS